MNDLFSHVPTSALVLVGPALSLLLQFAFIRPNHLGMMLKQRKVYVTAKHKVSINEIDTYEEEGVKRNQFILRSFYKDLSFLKFIRNVLQPVILIISLLCVALGFMAWFAIVATIIVSAMAVIINIDVNNATRV